MALRVQRAIWSSTKALKSGYSSAAPRFVCPQCRHNIAAKQPVQHATRSFSVSSPLAKKGGKAKSAQAMTDSPPQDTKGVQPTAVDDAFDLGELEAKNLKAFAALSSKLAELRPGGRINPEVIEKLSVRLKGDEEDGGRSVKVRDLAQVVAKGRFILIIAAEAEHLQPISSAVLASSLNLNPQGPAPDAPTTLTIPMPPPTGESRQLALEQAQKWADEALSKIREARGTHHKKLRKFSLDKSVRPDDIQKANKKMEEVVKAANEEAKRILDGAKKVLQG